MYQDNNINIFEQDFQENAFKYYENLRAKGNVVYIKKSSCFLALGYNEVKTIFSNAKSFSSFPLNHIDEILLSADGDKHQETRKILSEKLINLKKSSLPDLNNLSHQVFNALENQLEVGNEYNLITKLVHSYAFYMATAAAGLLKIPKHLDFLTANCNFDDILGEIDGFFNDWDKTYDFILPIIENIEENETLLEIKHLFQESGVDTEKHFAKFVKMFVVAGTETTASLMSSCLWLALRKNKFHYSKLTLTEKLDFVEETARLYAPAQITFRKAIEDVQIENVSIKKGDLIAVSIAAANRDPNFFENPQNFELHRKYKSLSFGYGKHRCIGEHLGVRLTLSFLDSFFSSKKDFIFQSEKINHHSYFTFSIGEINAKAMNTKVILNDKTLKEKLEKQGYVVLKSFLDKKTTSTLINYYQKTGLNAEKTQPNYLYANPDLSREISETIKSKLQDNFNENFEKGNLLGGVFMVKKPGNKKEVDFHQDWSLVDEREFISYNLWCPLVDTEVESGALMIIDKSDKAGLPFRSSTFPPLEVKHEKKYDRFIKKFTLKAGDAILYKHSLFHGSDNNQSNQDRVAIACGILPENIPFIYQHWNESNSILETYEVDRAFYIKHIHEVLGGKIPEKYKIISRTKFDEKPCIDEKGFYKKLRKLHGVKRFFFFD